MTSFTETSKFDDSITKQSQNCSKSNDARKCYSPTNTNNEKGQSSINTEMDILSAESSQISKKTPEMCAIHSRNKTVKKEQTLNDKTNSSSLQNESYLATDLHTVDYGNKTFSSELGSDISELSHFTADNSSGTQTVLSKMQNKDGQTEQSDKTSNTDMPANEVLGLVSALNQFNEETKADTKTTFLKPKGNSSQQIPLNNESHVSKENNLKTDSQVSLPDILGILHKSPNEKVHETDNFGKSHLYDNVDVDKGKSLKSKSVLSQASYLPNLLSSEAFQNEMEMELKQLQSLHSLQANQSIYKLAYDENVTDQSEVDSRSPSPVDPESQVPSSLTSAEILIHEADSGSDAGSEDVELLPHRYESETFLNENKHVYVNKLSLAVELLRTQESLPYDDEFKRVVGENNIVPGIHSSGKENLGYIEDSCFPNTFNIANNFDKKCVSPSTEESEIISHCQLKHSAGSSNDSAIFSDIDFGNFEDDLCEPAKEADAQGNEIQDNSEEIRAGYRRFGVQARHYFSPRAALSLNPCFCCIIM